MSLTFDCWRRHFFWRGEVACFHWEDWDFICGSKSRIHISSMENFCSKTAHLLPRSSAAVLLRPSCELLSVFAQPMCNPLCSDFSLPHCLSHDSENWSCWHVCFMRNFFTWFASIFFQRRANDNHRCVGRCCYGRPLLKSSWMLTRPSQKGDAPRDTVLRYTTLSP